MLNNLKVGTKLAVGFAVAILALVIVAAIGISRIASISEEVSLMVNDRFPKTEAGNNIVHAINITARALRNAALVKSPDEVARELARIPEARKITAETFKNWTRPSRATKAVGCWVPRWMLERKPLLTRIVTLKS